MIRWFPEHWVTASVKTQPTWFVPHGGGPCFFMDWTMGPPDTWDRMATWLRGLAASLPEPPKAIIVFSEHWEEPVLAVTTAAQPSLIYDYYGFSEHTYQLTYPAHGEPEFANLSYHDTQRRRPAGKSG